MASRIEICNLALVALDAGTITTLTDGTKAAGTLGRVYPVVRDGALAEQNWQFAIRRFNPALLASVPLYGFTNEYQLPADCLRLVEVAGLGVGEPSLGARYFSEPYQPYQVEGGKLLCNSTATLNCRGVFRQDNEASFDPLFVQYLALSLAEAAHDTLTRKGGAKLEQIMQRKMRALRLAVSRGAIAQPPEEIPDESWILSRVGP